MAVCREDILDVLRTIDDPEMPINIVDLGLVERIDCVPHAEGTVTQPGVDVVVELLPTFVGCHALPFIEAQVRRRIGEVPGVAGVQVRFVFDPPWSVDRITQAGRTALAQFGVTVPQRTATALAGEGELVALGTPRPTACPFCQSSNVRLESRFGPTRCRMIYYCEACRNSFEHLKRV